MSEIQAWVDAAKIQSYDGEEFRFRDDDDDDAEERDADDSDDNDGETPRPADSAKEWRDFISLSQRRVTQSSTIRRVDFTRDKLLSLVRNGRMASLTTFLV